MKATFPTRPVATAFPSSDRGRPASTGFSVLKKAWKAYLATPIGAEITASWILAESPVRRFNR